MRVRWNRKSALPLLLLALLYTAGAAQLAQRHAHCDESLPEGLAWGIRRVDSGLTWLLETSSRLRLGSWLGNSWAPGSIGWPATSESPPEQPQPNPLTSFSSFKAHADNVPETLDYGQIKIEPRSPDGASQATVLRLIECATEPLVILARPQVVIVTAEFPRLQTTEGELADLPDSPATAPLTDLPCRFRQIEPDSSTI